MITELQKMYGKPPGVELQELVNMFHSLEQAANCWCFLYTTCDGKFKGRVQKKKPQGKAKGKEKGKGLKNSYPTKPKKPQPYKKERPAKDGQCHHCKEEGYWKRNCLVYIAE
ncbi:zinc finger, CCHC-type containing protein [Tanacetum coccineum]